MQPNFDQKKTDLDIFEVLKMSKNGFYKKSFGNACFLGGPYGVGHKSKKFGIKMPY